MERLSEVDPERCASRVREVGIDAEHAQEIADSIRVAQRVIKEKR